ncbi:hypothetical protein F4805DRAFT_54980 [Annulohypoxylon moriforme]|nr:hypothetical protein F4805DRAFT_54980 [Annulohypoxylon moriforme]
MSSPGPFPPEIIQGIVYYLTHDLVTLSGEPPRPGFFSSWARIGGGSHYATINRAWQVAVERETFAELHLNLRRLAEAEAILNGVPRRQKYVRVIYLDVILPRPDTSLPYPHLETEDERKQKNRALQDTFEAFLSTLKHWTPGPPIKLHLDAFALDDEGRREETDLEPLRDARQKYHLPLELEDPERLFSLGPVNVVKEISMEKNMLGGRRFSAAAVCTLLTQLQAVKATCIHWWDAKENPKSRSEVNQALTHITHTIDHFHLGGSYSLPWRQIPVRQVNQSEAKTDELSRTLGMISQRMETLNLHEVPVSDEIFLQPNLVPEMTSPAHWARLKVLLIYYPIITPSGEWLFYLDPEVPDDEKGAVVPYSASLQRRYLAAARAALEMPLLQHMILEARVDHDEDWHKFWYNYNEKDKVAKAVWTSSSDFVPDDEVLEAWREVPRKHFSGVELKVEISDDEWAI